MPSFKDRLKAFRETIQYVRNYQLVENVAFQVLRAEQLPDKIKPSKMNNTVVCVYDDNIKIRLYMNSKYEKLTKEDLIELNEDIQKGAKYYMVSVGAKAGNNILVELVHADDLAESKYVIFDCNNPEHKLKPVLDSQVTPSPLKRKCIDDPTDSAASSSSV